MINIVLPIAGRGSRFKEAGYELPKPLIPVHGKPMIELVVENVKPKEEHRFIFLALDDHLKNTHMKETLERIAPGSVIIPVKDVTEGAACTVLLAKDYINNEDALMLANSDQWVDFDINQYLASMDQKQADGLIMTMKANDPKWSFAKLDENGLVTETVEKKVVSDEATVGIYNFKKGADYVWAAETMIQKNIRVNNEFYVAPVYNQLIEKGKKIVIFNVGSVGNGMYGLGTPADLDKFLEDSLSKTV